MTDDEAYKLERKFPDLEIMDSNEQGLKYIYDDALQGIGIAGRKGKTFLTPAQAYALGWELLEVLQHIGMEV